MIGWTNKTRCWGLTIPSLAANGTMIEAVNHTRVIGGILLYHWPRSLEVDMMVVRDRQKWKIWRQRVLQSYVCFPDCDRQAHKEEKQPSRRKTIISHWKRTSQKFTYRILLSNENKFSRRKTHAEILYWQKYWRNQSSADYQWFSCGKWRHLSKKLAQNSDVWQD